MKKLSFIAGCMAFTALAGMAQTQVFETENLGDVYGVSANGQYAAITDDENSEAYLWDRATGQFTNISEPLGDKSIPSGQRVIGTNVFAVTDNGVAVGCIMYADGVSRPAIYQDGKWSLLPLSEYALNTNAAIAVTEDLKYISGYQFYVNKSATLGGGYRPCRWTLGDDGKYTLESYADINLYNHQGFYPQAASRDGRYICGALYCGVGSTLPVYLDMETGEFFQSAEITTKSEPWIYKGKYYCGTDENGKQIWTDDPDDPRIVLFTETYIDGVKDEGTDTSTFKGYFAGIDNDGCLYGSRTIASNVDPEEGTGTLSSGATIYNVNTKEWEDDFGISGYVTGLNKGQYIFGAGNSLYINGKGTTFTGEFDFATSKALQAFSRVSDNGQVIGGCTYEINPAIGEPQFYPIIIVLDHPLIEITGVQDILTQPGSKVAIVVSAGHIDVQNAASVAVYDMQGRLVSADASSYVPAGMYVVKADNTVRKVVVK